MHDDKLTGMADRIIILGKLISCRLTKKIRNRHELVKLD